MSDVEVSAVRMSGVENSGVDMFVIRADCWHVQAVTIQVMSVNPCDYTGLGYHNSNNLVVSMGSLNPPNQMTSIDVEINY